jgi:hypothetical protein
MNLAGVGLNSDWGAKARCLWLFCSTIDAFLSSGDGLLHLHMLRMDKEEA